MQGAPLTELLNPNLMGDCDAMLLGYQEFCTEPPEPSQGERHECMAHMVYSIAAKCLNGTIGANCAECGVQNCGLERVAGTEALTDCVIRQDRCVPADLVSLCCWIVAVFDQSLARRVLTVGPNSAQSVISCPTSRPVGQKPRRSARRTGLVLPARTG